MSQTPIELREEIKRAMAQMKNDFDSWPNGVERNAAVGCEKADLAIWAVHRLIIMLDEHFAQGKEGGQ